MSIVVLLQVCFAKGTLRTQPRGSTHYAAIYICNCYNTTDCARSYISRNIVHLHGKQYVRQYMTLLPLAQKCHGRPNAEPAGQDYHDLGKYPSCILSTIKRALGQHYPCHSAHVEQPILMVMAWEDMLCAYHGTNRRAVRQVVGHAKSIKNPHSMQLKYLTLFS